MFLYRKIYILLSTIYSMVEKKKKISLTIDAVIWNKAQHYCLDANLDYSSFVEQLIKEKLDKKK